MVTTWSMASNLRENASMVLEIGLRIVLFLVFWYLEDRTPFYRPIKHEELWLYQNPLHHHDTVSTPLLLTMAVGIPSAFIVTHYLSTRQYIDLRQGLLGLFLAASLTGVVTDLIKLSVGRPRPDFFYRCFLDGKTTSDLQCTGPPDLVKEGRKSFPSGHSAWMFACFGYLSLYLLGKLQCFRPSGHGEGWRLCLALSPLMASTLIALSRFQDFRHHWDDILVGSLLGFLIAVLCYHHHYPPVWNSTGHAPFPPLGFCKGAELCVGGVGGKPVTTSPLELGAVSDDCELGNPTNLSLNNGSTTLPSRRF